MRSIVILAERSESRDRRTPCAPFESETPGDMGPGSRRSCPPDWEDRKGLGRTTVQPPPIRFDRANFLKYESGAISANKTQAEHERGRTSMRKTLFSHSPALVAAALLTAATANAAGTVKIGMVLPLSGQFADTGIQLLNGAKTYVKQHGDTVAGKKIEFVVKDVGGINPPVAKRLSQELIVRDKVDILGGYVLTPNAFAGGDVSKEAHKFMVVMNAATATITLKSPEMIRTSMTLPQAGDTFGHWAATKGHIKSCYTMVTDYGPGHRRRAGLHQGVQGGRRQDHRLGALPGRQSRFRRLRAAREGPQSGMHLHLRAWRHAAGRHRQGADRARSRSAQDQDSRHRRTDRRTAAQDHGRRCTRHHQRLALRLQQDNQQNKPSSSSTTKCSTAIPTCSRSAAMTACTRSMRH